MELESLSSDFVCAFGRFRLSTCSHLFSLDGPRHDHPALRHASFWLVCPTPPPLDRHRYRDWVRGCGDDSVLPGNPNLRC